MRFCRNVPYEDLCRSPKIKSGSSLVGRSQQQHFLGYSMSSRFLTTKKFDIDLTCCQLTATQSFFGDVRRIRKVPERWLPSESTNRSWNGNVIRCSRKELDVEKETGVKQKEDDKVDKVNLSGMVKEPIRTLLLDNYDSYTYNLYQLLSVINGVTPVVLRNDEITWDDLCHLIYEERAFHNVVISPGPGSPSCAADVGICMQLLRECHDIPILGVCLGHQALGFVHGAPVVHAPEPVHGRLSEVEHNGHPLFLNIPSGANSGFKVVRYHSLMIDAETLPQNLVPTAWTVIGSGSEMQECQPNTRVLMGVSHRSWPHHGVQFHPESICTTYGKQILENFRNMTVKFWEDQAWRPTSLVDKRGILRSVDFRPCIATVKDRQITIESPMSPILVDPNLIGRGNGGNGPTDSLSFVSNEEQGIGRTSHCSVAHQGRLSSKAAKLRLHYQKMPGMAAKAGGSRTLFKKLFAEESVEDTFWLDSSSLEQGRARFSFMGGKGGSLWKRVTYNIGHDSMKDMHGGVLRVENAAGEVTETFLGEGFLDFLNKELESRQCRREDYVSLPFDFCGGFIGYLGYELKIECGAQSNQHKSPFPDAGMFLADRLVVIDQINDDIYVLALFEDADISSSFGDAYQHSEDVGSSLPSQEIVSSSSVDERKESFFKFSDHLEASYLQNGAPIVETGGECFNSTASKAWVGDVVRKVKFLAQDQVEVNDRKHYKSPVPIDGDMYPPFVAEKSRDTYIEDVKKCQNFIRDGESYEICFTNQLKRKFSTADCLELYLTLRETNPAPYAAWLHLGNDGPCICSSSPERFLQLNREAELEAKPIKGTAPRCKTAVDDEIVKYQLEHGEKFQAENLMIVDLLRNDLSRVCEPGSVHVPNLMVVESYSTLHMLVSTVRGLKRPDVTPIDCVRAAFPGGSMTGAPKLRTMEIIDSLESSPRGVYSGTIGYFSFNSTFDLNIVIRTLVIHRGEASIGTGGAVIALSDPVAEYEEMLLKSKAPINAVFRWENGYMSSIEGYRAPINGHKSSI